MTQFFCNLFFICFSQKNGYFNLINEALELNDYLQLN